MPNHTMEHLDADELLQLAIRASEANRHEDALSYLKRALDLSPKNGKIHYLLGAEHAQIGLYDRAAVEMARAVELEPDLHTARFQLGLLHITSGRVDQAESTWKPLDALGAEHPLSLFKTGLLHLARDEFDQSIHCLKRGIGLNASNMALNKDMQRIVNEVEARRSSATAAQAAGTKPSGTKVSQPAHMLLSAYRDRRDDDKK